MDIVRADAWRGYRELVADLGGDAESFLRAANVDVSLLGDPDAYLSFRCLMLSYEIAADRLKMPDFGMRLAARQSTDSMGPLSVAILHSHTGREGAECGARYLHFHNPSIQVLIERADSADCDIISQEVLMARAPRHVQLMERTIAFQHMLLRRMCGAAYAPVEVWLRHQRLSPPETYRQVFGVLPRFGASKNAIVVKSAVLDAPQAGRSAQLRRVAIDFLQAMGPNADASLTERVRAGLRSLLRGGGGAQVDLARALGMHERTLQRRLKAETTSFEEIKDEVRREMAIAYLSQRQIPLSQVADMLGYAEPSALSRSCRRWFGESPRAVRKRLTEGRAA